MLFRSKEFKVLIDREEGVFFVGRTEYDSPEVDQEVLIKKDHHNAKVGSFCLVRIIDSNEYDLFGEVLSL